MLDLIVLRKSGHLKDGSRVVEIGAQQLSNSFLRATDEITELYGLFGQPTVDLGQPHDVGTAGGVELLSDDAPSSQTFWEALGFSYEAVDYGGHRNSLSLDLNRHRVPWRLRSSSDLVVNAGTTEHVANQDNAFRVIHDLIKPGGVMMHVVPAGGMLTHGLFSYNLQFFWLLCRENNYEVLNLGLQHYGEATISPDVVYSNSTYAKSGANLPRADLALPLLGINAILRKPTKKPYVTVLDVPNEAR